MQSLFPTNSQIGGNTSSIVQFRAGKCQLAQQANGKFLVSADLRRGQVSLVKGSDNLLHFRWSNFSTGAIEDDRIIMAGEGLFKRVKTGRDSADDRVYMLKFISGGQPLMFWMQDKDASKDEEIVRKVNETLKNPDSVSRLNGSSNAAAAARLPLTSGTLGGLDLSSILTQIGANQPPLPAPSSSHPSANSSASGRLTIDDLRRAMERPAASSASRPTPSLSEILTADEVRQSTVLDDAEVRDELISQLPLEQQSAEHLNSTLRSPQFQQALSALSDALRNGESFPNIMSNFQLPINPSDPSLARGDGVGAFLSAIQSANPPTTSGSGSNNAGETTQEEGENERMQE